MHWICSNAFDASPLQVHSGNRGNGGFKTNSRPWTEAM